MKLLAINFHYFREVTYSGGIYPISKRALNNQIEELAKYYSFISQEELCHILSSGEYLDGNYCIITLDDGLKEQMEAFNFLKVMGIPSILYVPTYPIRESKVLDVHKLHLVRSQLKDVEILDLLNQRYDIYNYKFSKKVLSNQYRYDDETASKIKYFLNFVLSEEERQKTIDFFFSSIVKDESLFAANLYMNEEDLRYLAKFNSLGSHGSDHVPLSRQPINTASKDIHNSITYLEQLTNSKIKSFSYPYGGKSAVDEWLKPIFKNTNVQFAFTMSRGYNSEAELSNPLLLKRIDTNDAPGGKLKSEAFIPKQFFN